MVVCRIVNPSVAGSSPAPGAILKILTYVYRLESGSLHKPRPKLSASQTEAVSILSLIHI